jgi:hypothetical protein
MTTYTDVFGGANIYPSEISYSALALTVDVELSWPEETSTNQNLATKIMDISAVAAGRSIILPAANKTGNGNTILFNNIGANPITIRNQGNTQLVVVAPGTVWQVYLTNNTTANGSWKTLQFGATTSTVDASSLAGTGIVAVGTLLSQSVPISAFGANYTAGVSDRAKFFLWNASGSGTLTLPDPVTVGNNWFIYVRNAGGGDVTVQSTGSVQIDGLGFKTYQLGDSSIIASDGSNFYTIGFGQDAVFVFDYTVIDVSGTGDYVLAGSELNRIAYRFTGTLSGNRNIVVPDTVQQYWVDNSTTGSYIFRVISTTTGVGVTINQGARAILYCNGSSVVTADTGGIAIPLPVNQGGTGATSANAALVNFGGTTLGINVFTAGSQSAAWTALGSVNGGTF